jgi:hypothetical protein
MGVKRRPGAPDLKEFISKGLGNRIGLHVYDASPTFDFNLTGFLGEGVGRFGGARGRLNDDMFMASFLISSLNSPVYIAVPVKDAQIVDAFLDELDAALAAQARQRERGGWFPLDYDFYKVPLVGGDRRIRCFGVGLGPVKWRLFFARLDDGLYVASKQFILEDLAAMKARPGGDGPTAHGMVRIRAENWKAVLPEYRLGWEENARQACLNNLGPLSSVARAVSAMQGGAAKAADVHRQADELHAVHFFCPDGGRYEASADGKQVTCSIHGSAAEPRQLAAPARGSATARLMREFAGATAELTFLEDGLHAVVTVKRK